MKIKQSRGAANKPELARTEWDFRNIPKSEIEACFIYEYTRELARRRPRGLNLEGQWKWDRAVPKNTPKRYEAKLAVSMFANCVPGGPLDLPMLAANDWFPKKSWQELDQKVRSRLVERLSKARDRYSNLTIYTLRELKAAKLVNITSMEEFRRVHEIVSEMRKQDLDQTEYGFFALNWNCPDAEIERAFAKWLSKQRRDREQCGLARIKYTPKRRGGFKDRLNWLGALRVREHYPRTQLVDYPNQRLKIKDPPYWNLTDLYEAAKKADQLLNMLLVDVLLNRVGRS